MARDLLHQGQRCPELLQPVLFCRGGLAGVGFRVGVRVGVLLRQKAFQEVFQKEGVAGNPLDRSDENRLQRKTSDRGIVTLSSDEFLEPRVSVKAGSQKGRRRAEEGRREGRKEVIVVTNGMREWKKAMGQQTHREKREREEEKGSKKKKKKNE